MNNQPTITEGEIREKASYILGGFQPDLETPARRFCFRSWHRADYQALDRLLAHAPLPTSRFVLPADEGILVASAGIVLRDLPIR